MMTSVHSCLLMQTSQQLQFRSSQSRFEPPTDLAAFCRNVPLFSAWIKAYGRFSTKNTVLASFYAVVALFSLCHRFRLLWHRFNVVEDSFYHVVASFYSVAASFSGVMASFTGVMALFFGVLTSFLCSLDIVSVQFSHH